MPLPYILANFLEYYQIFHNSDLHLQLKNNMDKISTLLSNPYPQTMEEFILMDIERQGIKQGLEQGKQEGKMEGLEMAALNMLIHSNIPVEEVARILGLSEERVLQLKKTIKKDNSLKYVYQPISQTKMLFQKLKQYWKSIWSKS